MTPKKAYIFGVMYKRMITPLKSRSFFIFGARGTGKTTFIQSFFSREIQENKVLMIDLLKAEDEDIFSRNPDQLEELLKANSHVEWVIIDEVQKIPKLLDVIHRLIEKYKHKVKFALTGSSARKIKRGFGNLLAGRALVNGLYPLTFIELENDFHLNQALLWGTLPILSGIDDDTEKAAILRTYALTYLKEEVWNEHLIKDLDPFRKFLEVAAQCSSEIINHSRIGKQIGVSSKTVESYFDILEETYLGHHLEAYHSSVRKRLIQSPKFYFFDEGVRRALRRDLLVKYTESSYEYGKAFEHLVINHCFFLNSYYQKDFEFFYLKTKDGAEIDLIIKRPNRPLVLAEIKSSDRILQEDISSLSKFAKDMATKKTKILAYCLCLEKQERIIENVHVIPWEIGIGRIFAI